LGNFGHSLQLNVALACQHTEKQQVKVKAGRQRETHRVKAKWQREEGYIKRTN